MNFYMNNYKWQVIFVPSNSPLLQRSDGVLTVGVTDRNDLTVYLSDALRGAFLRKVLLHELCHCFIFSYNYDLTIEQEEFVCDFLASNAEDIISKADEIICIGIGNMKEVN